MTDYSIADEAILVGLPPALLSGLSLYVLETFLRVLASDQGVATVNALAALEQRGLVGHTPDRISPKGYCETAWELKHFYVPREIIQQIDEWRKRHRVLREEQ